MTPRISIHDELDAAAAAAAELLLERAHAALKARGSLSMALAGGSTPRALYAHMRAWTLPWPEVQLCFGDERCVPSDHPDSNARMVREALITPASIPDASVHAMRGELAPEAAASDYEQTLRRVFGDVTLPRFDLVLLGLGADGHTASLFPGSPALSEQRAWVASNVVPGLATPRVTLTFPVLNAARLVLFLVSGADKAAVVRELLEGTQDSAHIPARGVRPAAGELMFFLDRAAAAQLG